MKPVDIIVVNIKDLSTKVFYSHILKLIMYSIISSEASPTI